MPTKRFKVGARLGTATASGFFDGVSAIFTPFKAYSVRQTNVKPNAGRTTVNARPPKTWNPEKFCDLWTEGTCNTNEGVAETEGRQVTHHGPARA